MLSEPDPLLRQRLGRSEPLLWLNPALAPAAQALAGQSVTLGRRAECGGRLRGLAPRALRRLFPELTGGRDRVRPGALAGRRRRAGSRAAGRHLAEAGRRAAGRRFHQGARRLFRGASVRRGSGTAARAWPRARTHWSRRRRGPCSAATPSRWAAPAISGSASARWRRRSASTPWCTCRATPRPGKRRGCARRAPR